MAESGGKIKSLQKALNVLDCFVDHSELGVTQISEMMGLYKSNVHSILSTFKQCGYVEQDEVTGKYRLGVKIYKLSCALDDRYDVIQLAKPYMQEIANLTKERVYLGAPHGDEVIYLGATYPTGEFAMARAISGERAQMYCTGLGKAMMAYLTLEQQYEYANRPLEKFTENTLTDKEALLAELECVREKGYAIDNMEHEYGVKCVARPIFDRKRRVCAAISVSGPSLRFEDDRIKEISDILKRNLEPLQYLI
jgi:DNA-binding IclR family transcriptional regulator